jgi:hypothetical protein
MAERERRIVIAAWVAAAAAMLVTSWTGFFFFRDNFATHYPLKWISAASMRALDIPWWNFHAGGGQPLAGNPNALTFYPDSLLYLVLPVHAAFNLHFLLHLGGGWMAMRKLTSSPFAATVYVLSGAAISATAFYNLVTAVALIPLALLGVERRSPTITGAAFGLMLLAAEPVTLIGAALSVLIAGRMHWRAWLQAAGIAAVIGSPQLIAFSEIAFEVERVLGSSARTVLNTSLGGTRIAEIFLWPFSGFLNDAGGNRQRLFSTLFLGAIALPALFRRSRYTVIALVMLFLAAGRFNPIVAFAVEHVPALRIMRFPEKFALPLTAALVVLIARFYADSRYKRVWMIVTIVPLLYTTVRALPIDWFAAYDVDAVAPRRVIASTAQLGALSAREEHRIRAQRLEPLFGAVAGMRYVLQRSPDRMHSTLSRIAFERHAAAPRRYREVALGPPASIVAHAVPAAGMQQAVQRFEQGENVAPFAVRSAPARVTRYSERGQTIEIEIESAGPALLLVNQSYFHAWHAELGGEELDTVPVNLDRLGVLAPRSGTVRLKFGRRRIAVIAAWILSLSFLGYAIRRRT